MSRSFATMGLMFALTACRSADPPASPQVDDPPAASPAVGVIPSTPIPTPVSLKVDGTYVHPGSSIAFPEKAANFVRSDVHQFDREGADVGVHYRRILIDSVAVFRTEATVFVFPSKRRPDGTVLTFDEQFDGEVREVRETNLDVRELRRVNSDSSRGGTTAHVRAAEFTFQGGKELGHQAMMTMTAAFQSGPWRVSYRADYPPARRDECVATLEQLLVALDLPPTGLPATTR